MHASSRLAVSPQQPDRNGLHLAVLACLGIIVAVAYLPMWRILPYADDLARMRRSQAGLFEGAFAGTHMFRPLELAVIESSFYVKGDMVLAKLVGFLGFMLSIGLVFWLARRLEPRQSAVAIVAGALFACHPVNVSAVIQIDTLSQQLATVFVLCGFAWYAFGPHESPLRYHAIGAGFSFLALLSKEVSTGAIFALPLVMALVQRFVRGWPMPVAARRWLIAMAIAAGLLLAYMAMRMLSGAALVVEEGRYSLEYSPFSVVKNALLLLGSMGYLGSTLEIFLLDSSLRIALSVFVSTFVNGLALLGVAGAVFELYRDGSDRQPLTLVGAAGVMLLASLFPAALIKHPSELYAYLGTPFYALLVGFFAVRGWNTTGRWLRLSMRGSGVSGAGLIAVCCLWLLFGVHEKLAFAERMGERTEMFSEQMGRWYAGGDAPLAEMAACVAVVDEKRKDGPYYSVFKMSDDELLQYIYVWLQYQHAARLGQPWRPAGDDRCQVMIEVGGEGRLRLRRVNS